MENKFKVFTGIVIGVVLAIYLISSAFIDFSSDITNIEEATDTNVFTAINATAVLFGDTTADSCTTAVFTNSSGDTVTTDFTIGGTGNCYATLNNNAHNNTDITANYIRVSDFKGGALIPVALIVFALGSVIMFYRVFQ